MSSRARPVPKESDAKKKKKTKARRSSSSYTSDWRSPLEGMPPPPHVRKRSPVQEQPKARRRSWEQGVSDSSYTTDEEDGPIISNLVPSNTASNDGNDNMIISKSSHSNGTSGGSSSKNSRRGGNSHHDGEIDDDGGDEEDLGATVGRAGSNSTKTTQDSSNNNNYDDDVENSSGGGDDDEDEFEDYNDLNVSDEGGSGGDENDNGVDGNTRSKSNSACSSNSSSYEIDSSRDPSSISQTSKRKRHPSSKQEQRQMNGGQVMPPSNSLQAFTPKSNKDSVNIDPNDEGDQIAPECSPVTISTVPVGNLSTENSNADLSDLPKPDGIIFPSGMPRYDPDDFDSGDDEDDDVEESRMQKPSSPEQESSDPLSSDEEHEPLNDTYSDEGSITLKDDSNDNDNGVDNTAGDTGDFALKSSGRSGGQSARNLQNNYVRKSSRNFSAESTISSKPSHYNIRDRQFNPDDFDSNEFDYKSEEWDSGSDDDDEIRTSSENDASDGGTDYDNSNNDNDTEPSSHENQIGQQANSQANSGDENDQPLAESYTEPLNDDTEDFHGGDSSKSPGTPRGPKKNNLQNSFASAPSENSGVGFSVATYSPNTTTEGTVSIDAHSPMSQALSIDTFTDSPKRSALSVDNLDNSDRGERIRPQRSNPKRGGGFHSSRQRQQQEQSEIEPSDDGDGEDDDEDMRELNVEDFDSDDDDEDENDSENQNVATNANHEGVDTDDGVDINAIPLSPASNEGDGGKDDGDDDDDEGSNNIEGTDRQGEDDDHDDEDTDYWDENNYMRGVYPNEEDDYDDDDDPVLYQQESAPRYDYNDSDSDPMEEDYNDYQEDEEEGSSDEEEWSSDYDSGSSGYYEPGLSTVGEETPSQLDVMMNDSCANFMSDEDVSSKRIDGAGAEESSILSPQTPRSEQSFGWESLPLSGRASSGNADISEESLDLFGDSTVQDSSVQESPTQESPVQRKKPSSRINPLEDFEEEGTDVDESDFEEDEASGIGSQLDAGDFPTPPTSEQLRNMTEQQDDTDEESSSDGTEDQASSNDDNDDGTDVGDPPAKDKKEERVKRLHLCLTIVCCLFFIFDIILFLIWVARNHGIDRGDGDAKDDFLRPSRIVASVPQTICLEYIPGIPLTDTCGSGSSPSRRRAQIIQNTELSMGDIAGTVGDVLALAIWNVTWEVENRRMRHADLALIHAGMGQNDIIEGPFSVQNAMDLLVGRFNKDPLVVLEVTGRQLKQVLEDSTEFALGYEKADLSSSYPFGAGIRFQVIEGASIQNRVINIEVMEQQDEIRSRQLRGSFGRVSRKLVDDSSGKWRPLDQERVYSVVTTQQLAQGGEGYLEFAEVIDRAVWLDSNALEALVGYADWKQILEPPSSGSTLKFLKQ